MTRFGAGFEFQPIEWDYFSCAGLEANLSECRRSRGYTCGHNEDASVICSYVCELLSLFWYVSLFSLQDAQIIICSHAREVLQIICYVYQNYNSVMVYLTVQMALMNPVAV